MNLSILSHMEFLRKTFQQDMSLTKRWGQLLSMFKSFKNRPAGWTGFFASYINNKKMRQWWVMRSKQRDLE